MAGTAYVRTFNRFELKYVVPMSLLGALLEALDEHVVADPYGDSERGYGSHSVYCDSPRQDFFWEKVEGISFRRKLRFRRYQGQPDVFIEIKQRIGRTVQKRRVRWPLERLHAVFMGGSVKNATDEERADRVAAEIILLWRTYDLRPTVSTSYRRLALQGVYDPGLRITFDTNVRYDANDLDVMAGITSGEEMVSPDISIMEVKFNDRAPEWLSEFVTGFDLKAMRISKYCRAVDLHFHGGRFT